MHLANVVVGLLELFEGARTRDAVAAVRSVPSDDSMAFEIDLVDELVAALALPVYKVRQGWVNECLSPYSPPCSSSM